jgi:hypothetical protein
MRLLTFDVRTMTSVGAILVVARLRSPCIGIGTHHGRATTRDRPYKHIQRLPKFLYSEEQVPDLVDYLGVSTRLAAWKALIGGEDKV